MMRWSILIAFAGIEIIIGGSLSVCHAGFGFARPEIELVEAPYYPNTQNDLDCRFDSSGNVHFVWKDDRDSASQTYGNTVLLSGDHLQSYWAYPGFPSNDYVEPAILDSMAFPDNMFVLSYNTVLNTLALGQYDLSGLPVSVLPSTLSIFPGPSPSLDAMKAISVLSRINYGYESAPDLRFGGVELGTLTWDSEYTIPAPPDGSLNHFDCAVDAENFIYVCYDQYDFVLDQYQLVVRRSVNAGDFSSGFHMAHIISTHDFSAFYPTLAVTGSLMTGDLFVSVLYVLPDPALQPIECVTEFNGDWMTPGFIPLTSPTTVNDVFGASVSIVNRGIDAQYCPFHRHLHVVWADNRVGYKASLYGDTSYDLGMSWGIDTELLPVGDSILEAPRLILGPNPGHKAVAYIRNADIFFNPYALVSNPEFLDSCDSNPALFWDAHGGVVIDASNYHGFSGASYALTENNTRGTLVRDYGGIEQEGIVDLFFYDTMSTADFTIILENANGRGVIRMLGVHNETTPTHYAYSPDGVNWQSLPDFRSLGWHHVVITVSASGAVFQIETYPGVLQTVSDPGFTSFTRLEIDGQDATPPYNVDDIQVEVYAMGGQPPVIPAISPGFLGILIIAITGHLLLRRPR
ncbi:hypothetical protein JXA80_08035 [bacterium]|nr:hypothetical protein [candidate division CSSED10-310 bacterium]